MSTKKRGGGGGGGGQLNRWPEKIPVGHDTRLPGINFVFLLVHF